MIGEDSEGRLVRVRFSFPNEPSGKVVEVLVNRYSPLINYKRQIENSQSQMDLFAKRIYFRYVHSNKEAYLI